MLTKVKCFFCVASMVDRVQTNTVLSCEECQLVFHIDSIMSCIQFLEVVLPRPACLCSFDMSGKNAVAFSSTHAIAKPSQANMARVLTAQPSKELDPTKNPLWELCWQRGLRLDPHNDHVSMYKRYNDGRQYFVHDLILERVQFAPNAIWEMAFDDHGYGGVFDTTKVVGGGEPFLMEELFRQNLSPTQPQIFCKFMTGHHQRHWFGM